MAEAIFAGLCLMADMEMKGAWARWAHRREPRIDVLQEVALTLDLVWQRLYWTIKHLVVGQFSLSNQPEKVSKVVLVVSEDVSNKPINCHKLS